MLADHLHAAAAGARTTASLDETARLLWRAHAEAQIPDAEAGAISEAIEARRAALAGKCPAERPRPALGLSGAARRPERREKMFGLGRPRALDRNAKVRIMHWARCLARRTEKGKAYGAVTAKALAVLEALLWGFHNACSGLCFPSYEKIAEAAGCARSTVAEALKALEDAGNPVMGATGSSGCASVARTFWATTAGAGGCCGLQTPIISATPDRTILPSPKSRLEHRFKIFPSIKGGTNGS